MKNSTTIDPNTTPATPDGLPPITLEDLQRALAAYGSLCEDDGWLHGRHGIDGELPDAVAAEGAAAWQRRSAAYAEVLAFVDRYTLTTMRLLPPHDPSPLAAVVGDNTDGAAR